jgi:hypothetical protein
MKAGFEVLTVVSTKMAVFWVVATCARLHGATTQKTSIFVNMKAIGQIVNEIF